jgi:hypothetical protein
VPRKEKRKKRSKSGSGRLSGMRSGFKSFLGGSGGQKKQESLLSKIIWYTILVAALGAVVYFRFIRSR